MRAYAAYRAAKGRLRPLYLAGKEIIAARRLRLLAREYDIL